MRRYHVEEIPVELREDLLNSPSFTIYDNDKLETEASLEIESYGAACYLWHEDVRTTRFDSLEAALLSIGDDLFDFDLPDYLFEQLTVRA